MSAAGEAWPSVAELAAQERELRWQHFDEDDAWRLGSALVARARGAGAAGGDRHHPR